MTLLELWAAARIDLELEPEEIWRLDPGQIHALFERWKSRERLAFWRAGLVAVCIVNVNRKKGTRARRIEDFIPESFRPPPGPAPGPKQLLGKVAMINAMFGGLDLRRQGEDGNAAG